ncbi:MAG: alkaline phosphatase D [Planctomycetota bacterium]|jgi:alkaline phosphatase D
MKKTEMFLLLLLGASISCATKEQEPIKKIAFGSCIKSKKPVPILDEVNRYHPELFIFMGDNIYGDTSDMKVLKAKYEILTSKPAYQELKSRSRILATWDDHDYGANDSGREYAMKAESQQIFLDTFDEPLDSDRRSQEGIYASYFLGPKGKRLQIILLDNRYHRSALIKGERKGKGGSYLPNPDSEATMLGEAQWAWLETELLKEADVRLVIGGTQILTEHNGFEAWANFPLELERLFKTIRQSRASGVVFLSGDTHWTELSRRQNGTPYPLYDFTSSGLTEVWKHVTPNKYRFHDMSYLGVNFGAIEIDWERTDPVIRLKAIGAEGEILFQHWISLSSLQNPAQ